MEKALAALPGLQIPPRHLRSFKIYKVSPLGLLHRTPSCHLRTKSSSRGAVEIQWRQLMGSTLSPPRFVCVFGGGNEKRKQGADDIAQGAARKALEKALGGKRSGFSKWEETQKREPDVGGGGRGRGGRGWFGGGGWEGFFDFGDDEDGWEEILQVTYATLAVFSLYGMIIAPRELTCFIAYYAVSAVVYLLDRVSYYWWWLRMTASGRKIVKSKSYGSRSPAPSRRSKPSRRSQPSPRYERYDDMDEWD